MEIFDQAQQTEENYQLADGQREYALLHLCYMMPSHIVSWHCSIKDLMWLAMSYHGGVLSLVRVCSRSLFCKESKVVGNDEGNHSV